jgi:proteasome accessory factor A
MTRLMGSETEYTVTSTDPSSDFAASSLVNIGGLPSDIIGVDAKREYLSNGARYYLDIGHHPEYCTPETFGALASTISEFAGLEIVRATAGALRRRYDSQKDIPTPSDLKVFRRVSADGEQSSGHHINLRASKSLEVNSSALAPLLLHMIGGNILFGAGLVRKDGSYGISQKARYITALVSSSTTHSAKPLVNSRDEPLDDKYRWRRLHITGNDALFSPWATWLRLATFDICTALCESKPDIAKATEKYLPSNLMKSLRMLSDSTGQAIMTNCGQTMTARDMEWKVFETAVETYKSGDLDEDKLGEETNKAFDEWQSVLETEESDPDELTTLIDWRLRRFVHQCLDGKYGKKTDKDRWLRDIELDDMLKPTPGAVLFQDRLFNAGIDRLSSIFNIPSDDIVSAIRDRVATPPPGRATARGNFIAQHHGQECSVNWDRGRLTTLDGDSIDHEFQHDGTSRLTTGTY